VEAATRRWRWSGCRQREQILKEVSQLLKVQRKMTVDRIERLLEQYRDLEKTNASCRVRLQGRKATDIRTSPKMDGVSVIASPGRRN